jgi:hypothetical protein
VLKGKRLLYTEDIKAVKKTDKTFLLRILKTALNDGQCTENIVKILREC